MTPCSPAFIPVCLLAACLILPTSLDSTGESVCLVCGEWCVVCSDCVGFVVSDCIDDDDRMTM